MKLHASGEDYLKAVLILLNEKGKVRSVDPARFLGYSKTSVSRAVGNLRNGGFLTVEQDGCLRLTGAGREIAERIYERYRLFASLLTDAGIDPVTAEREACRMEHAVSQESFERIQNAYQRCQNFWKGTQEVI